MPRVAIIFLSASICAAVVFGQSMAEFGAVAAGTTVGAAGGKAASDGINSIFGKVDKQTAKAAGTDKTAKASARNQDKDLPAMKVAPGVPKDPTGGVPPVPAFVASAGSAGRNPFGSALRSAAHAKAEANDPAGLSTEPTQVEIPFTIGVLADALPAHPLPPPPTMTPEDLKKVTPGMSRDEVLRFGAPSSKMTTIDGSGHVIESYSYWAKGERFGSVHLTDGSVENVQVR